MKKNGLLVLIVAFAFLLFLPYQAKAQPSINSVTWFGSLYQSSFTDPYYGVYSLHAFTSGSTVTLYVPIQAQNYFGGNNTYVWSVSFKADWGVIYTSSNAFPQVMAPGSTYTFKIAFAAPDISTASNLYPHSGTIDVNYSTWAGGTRSDQTSNACGYGANCYVTYSSDQVTDSRIMQRFGSSLGVGLACGDLAGFTSAKASYLCLTAFDAFRNGTLTYASGDFSGAVPQLQQANSLLNQAISAQNDASQTAPLSVSSLDIPLIATAASILAASIIIAVSLRRRPVVPVAHPPSGPASTTS